MKRSIMGAIVKDSVEAVAFYQRAFDAKLGAQYKDEDGSYIHAEIDVCGQTIAVSELKEDAVSGNTMLFYLHYGEGNEDKVKKAYGVLKEGAEIIRELGPCTYSPLETDLIDKFGVHWGILV